MDPYNHPSLQQDAHIPVCSDMEVHYHDLEDISWEFDRTQQLAIYTGTCTFYFRDSPLASWTGDVRIAQRLPVKRICKEFHKNRRCARRVGNARAYRRMLVSARALAHTDTTSEEIALCSSEGSTSTMSVSPIVSE